MRRISIAGLILTTILTLELQAWAAVPDLKDVERRFGGPVLWVPKPKTPPVIDGQLDDACWQDARPVFLGFSTGVWWEAPSQKTEARVLADHKAIYFAVRCFEAQPDRIVRSGTARNGMILGADTVEFFLDPGCRGQRHDYLHIIVTPDGTVYRGRGLEPDTDKGSIVAKAGTFDGGWTVEAAIPLADLGTKTGAIPRIWGLNICRQRPELAADMPKAAKAAGNKRFDPPMWKLDEPDKYRQAEYTCWSPTMADFCGWPFYADSRPFHIAQRFGHAVLEVGTQDVAAPAKKFEVLYRSDFAGGQLGPFKNAVLVDDDSRGTKCLTFADGQNRIQFAQPLEDLDDVTLMLVFKLKEQVLPVQHLSITGKAPDGIWCGAERYEFLISKEEAETRSKFLEEYHKEKYGDGPYRLYDTHADMVRWKPCGGVRKGPGPFALVEGFFAEPSGGQVRWPGKDWVIARIRPALFRRAPQPKQGQKLVPLSQNYPDGLTLSANPRDGFRLAEMIVFRGVDTEPPARVTGVKARKNGEEIDVSWDRAKDNTVTAFYRIYAGKQLLAETQRLNARVKASALEQAPITIVAVDYFGNASESSERVQKP
jgi:hypothetical protein